MVPGVTRRQAGADRIRGWQPQADRGGVGEPGGRGASFRGEALLGGYPQDNDGDALKFRWEVSGRQVRRGCSTRRNLVVKFEDSGAHVARLTVTDPRAGVIRSRFRSSPATSLQMVTVKVVGNEMFYFTDQPFGYSVEVADREDGQLSKGQITPERVQLSIDYVPEGFDVASAPLAPARRRGGRTVPGGPGPDDEGQLQGVSPCRRQVGRAVVWGRGTSICQRTLRHPPGSLRR